MLVLLFVLVLVLVLDQIIQNYEPILIAARERTSTLPQCSLKTWLPILYFHRLAAVATAVHRLAAVATAVHRLAAVATCDFRGWSLK